MVQAPWDGLVRTPIEPAKLMYMCLRTCVFPLLGLEGIYHYPKYVLIVSGFKQMADNVATRPNLCRALRYLWLMA